MSYWPSCPGYTRGAGDERLGKGQYGEAYKEQDVATGELVAVKYIPRKSLNVTNAVRELRNHYALVHPGFVGFKRAVLTNDHLCLIVELCQKATLIDFVTTQPTKRCTEAQARCAVAQMLCAVAFAHERNIVHRDLKLCNALLVTPAAAGGVPVCKVCDMGYSKELSVATAARTFVGTSYYIPPEVFATQEALRARRTPTPYEGGPMDIYALGVSLLIMLRGDYPYSAVDAAAALEHGSDLARTNGLASLLIGEATSLAAGNIISQDCLRVMCACFAVDPAQRPTAAQLMADPWFVAGAPYPIAPSAPAPQQSLAELEAIIAALEGRRA